jgi:hypothetical protein
MVGVGFMCRDVEYAPHSPASSTEDFYNIILFNDDTRNPGHFALLTASQLYFFAST